VDVVRGATTVWKGGNPASAHFVARGELVSSPKPEVVWAILFLAASKENIAKYRDVETFVQGKTFSAID
jgi:hypothetical protein